MRSFNNYKWNIPSGFWRHIWSIWIPKPFHGIEYGQSEARLVHLSIRKHTLQWSHSQKFRSSAWWKALRAHVCWIWRTLHLQKKLHLDQETFHNLARSKIYLVRHWKASTLLDNKSEKHRLKRSKKPNNLNLESDWHHTIPFMVECLSSICSRIL